MKSNEFAIIISGLSRAVGLLEGLGHPDRLVQDALDKTLAIAARELGVETAERDKQTDKI